MEKKPSKKHHYLPRHYLSGFTNDEGGFFVYDKISDKIYSTGPSAAFFENDLNTVKYQDGSSSDFLESLYTEIENRSWSSLNRIRDSKHNTSINSLDKMNLYFFMLFLHWRLPSNIEFISPISEKFFRGNKNFDYFKLKSTDGTPVPIEVIEMLRSSSAFKKTAQLLVPFAPFFNDKNWSHSLENWHFLYSGDNQAWFMVGDNPIITRGYNDHNPIDCLREFVFPISGNILLISSKMHAGKMLPPEFTVTYNVAIIERAKRFVACQRKDFLKLLVDRYKIYVKHEKNDSIITELFDTLINN